MGSPDQRQALLTLGVPVGQGWLWGAAVCPATFAREWGTAGSPAGQSVASSTAGRSTQSAT